MGDDTMQDGFANGPSGPPAGALDLRRVSQMLAMPLRSLASARVRKNLTFDDALILLAIGHLNFGGVSRFPTARPAHSGEVSHLLKIPRETVRRKMKRLAEMEMIDIGQKGAIIAQVSEWQALANQLTGAR